MLSENEDRYRVRLAFIYNRIQTTIICILLVAPSAISFYGFLNQHANIQFTLHDYGA